MHEKSYLFFPENPLKRPLETWHGPRSKSDWLKPSAQKALRSLTAFCASGSFYNRQLPHSKVYGSQASKPHSAIRKSGYSRDRYHGRAQKGGKWAGIGRGTWQTESSFRITRTLTGLNNRGKAVGTMAQQESRKQNLSAVVLSPLLLDLSLSRIQSGWCNAQEASSSRQRWFLL